MFDRHFFFVLLGVRENNKKKIQRRRLEDLKTKEKKGNSILTYPLWRKTIKRHGENPTKTESVRKYRKRLESINS